MHRRPDNNGVEYHIQDFLDNQRCLGLCYDSASASVLCYHLNRSHRLPDLLGEVKIFHDKFGQNYDGPPRVLPQDLFDFRKKFMQEELGEYEEVQQWDVDTQEDRVHLLHNQLDALIDLIWVALGTVEAQGLAPIFYQGWRKVVLANMSKVKAEVSGDSRSKRDAQFDIVKPAGWVEPDHRDLIRSLT